MPCHRWWSAVLKRRSASVQEHYYSPEQVARREQATAAQAETQQAARQPNGKAARQRAIARRREVNHVRMLGGRLAQARQLIPMAEAALQQLLSQVSSALHHAACAEVRTCFAGCVSAGPASHCRQHSALENRGSEGFDAAFAHAQWRNRCHLSVLLDYMHCLERLTTGRGACGRRL